MKVEGKNLTNNLLKERKHLETEFFKDHINKIEKKILVSNSVGIDYTWYSMSKSHFKYNTENILSKIVNVLEKKNFGIRVFSKNDYYLIQIIWYNK